MADLFPTTGTQQGDINAGLISDGNYKAPTITPQSLTPTDPISLTGVNNPNPYPVSTLITPPTPPLVPTAQETQASGLAATLRGLYQSTIGKSAYQTQQNTIAGVDTAQKNINDLTAQLVGLKNEAAAIPLRFQQNASNGAISTGGLNSEQNQALLTNSIAALGVSTLLAASQGQLANAESLANKAVALKYDPIQEQIDATTKNLQLIKDDPAATLADKNRAQVQLDLQNKNKEQLAIDKQNATDVWKVATDAASNGKLFKPTTSYKTLPQALTAISKAKLPADALKIAAETGLTVKASTSSGTNSDGTTVPGTVGERQAQSLSSYTSALVPGAKYNGQDIIGKDGFIDPNVFKAAIQDAVGTKTNSLTRADFIKQFGHLLNPKNYGSYGLTPTELKLITG